MVNFPDEQEIQTEPRSNCLLCGSSGKKLYKNLKDKLFGAEGNWNFKECQHPDCQLIWLDPSPTKEDIMKAYRTYLTHENKKINRSFLESFLVYILNSIVSCSFAHERLKYMYLSHTKPGRLLEIGCGNGRNLAIMKSKGWDVVGQEIDPKAAEVTTASHGFKVYIGELESIALPRNSFDAIIINHVIEHVFDPLALLKECYQILKPGGKLVVVTPNTQSQGHKYFKENWIGLDPPRHLNIFSMSNLKTLGLKSGFDQCRTWTTTAREYVFARWSFLLKDNRGHLYEQMHMKAAIQALIFKIFASIQKWVKKDTGQECVLFAVK